jgi:hypothetical protein
MVVFLRGRNVSYTLPSTVREVNCFYCGNTVLKFLKALFFQQACKVAELNIAEHGIFWERTP